jgi:hypothetical protein
VIDFDPIIEFGTYEEFKDSALAVVCLPPVYSNARRLGNGWVIETATNYGVWRIEGP